MTMYTTSLEYLNLLSVHAVPVLAYSLFLSITDARSGVYTIYVIAKIKYDKEEYIVLIQASFTLLSFIISR